MFATVMFAFSSIGFATDSFYCPKTYQFIQIGMSADAVISHCGNPTSKAVSNQPVQNKVPMTQLIFNSMGSKVTPVINTQFIQQSQSNVRFGIDNGVNIEIDIVDNKVQDIKMNGNSTNSFSLCNETLIQVGDPISMVNLNCPNPSVVNQTFLLKNVQTQNKPELWTYQFDSFSPPLQLLMVDGVLNQIN